MDREKDKLVEIAAARSAPAGQARNLFGLDTAALTERMRELDEPEFRARQVADAMYRQRVTEVDAISTLPLALRRRLTDEGWLVGRPRMAQVFTSKDGTERYLIECVDPKRETVETVWMPEGDGGEEGEEAEEEFAPEEVIVHAWSRATLCVSSQIGCAVNCQFCLTARLGLSRSLTAGEIAGQVLEALERHKVEVGRDRINLVFMGMGEPLLNYENFMAAVRLLVREAGLSPRRMTVSTSGIVPGIEQLAQEPPELRPHLAISLNAPEDDLREILMPVNRKWPIAEIVEAARKIRLRKGERITFEYVLLGGVNDRLNHAQELARLVRRSGLAAKVNLIAWNAGPGLPYLTPHPQAVESFRRVLAEARVRVYVRKPRGRDIFAACGQLKRTGNSGQ
jgi:23S rRNA (adenine2503-C2)-methyltransferase